MKLPAGEARELGDAERWFALVEHFGEGDLEDTQPMPLEELPPLRGRPALQPTEFDTVMERLSPRRRA